MAGGAFDESFAVPAILHTPVEAQRVLAIGPAAVPLLNVARRYPSFRELVYLGEDAPAALRGPKPDSRVRSVTSTRDLPRDWVADVIGVAVQGMPESVLTAAKQLSGPQTVVVVAVDRYAAGPTVKRLVERLWGTVIPYRDHVPNEQLYLLASDMGMKRHRPMPGWTERLSEGYLTALFRFPKNDQAALFSPRAAAPRAASAGVRS